MVIPRRKEPRKLKKFLRRCNRVQVFQNSSLLAPVMFRRIFRFLNRLETVSLMIDEKNMPKGDCIFKTLRLLRSAEISVIRNKSRGLLGEKRARTLLLPICDDLLKIKALKRLRLNLEDLSHGDDIPMLEDVLELLGESRLENYDVKIYLKTTKRMLDIQKLRKFLGKIEVMIISYQTIKIGCIRKNTKLHREQNHALGQGQRTLSLTVEGNEELDLFSMIEECHSLHTIWLESKHEQILVPKRLLLPLTLRNVYLNFPFIPDKQAEALISSIVTELKGIRALETLGIALKSDNGLRYFDELKHFECIKNTKNFNLKVFSIGRGYLSPIKQELLTSLHTHLTVMTSLETLKLEFGRQIQAPLKYIQQILDSLPEQLKQFELTIADYYGLKTLGLYLPCGKWSKMVELRLDLCIPLSKTSIQRFMEELVEMKKLELLKIENESLKDPGFHLGNFLKKLALLENLRYAFLAGAKDYIYDMKDGGEEKIDVLYENRKRRAIV